jgi:hypothetical protein
MAAPAEGAGRWIGGLGDGQLLHKLACFLFSHLANHASKHMFGHGQAWSAARQDSNL